MVEITSYVLGMLTIAAILLITALVLGIVKINKLDKQTITIKKMIDDVINQLITKEDILKNYFNLLIVILMWLNKQ